MTPTRVFSLALLAAVSLPATAGGTNIGVSVGGEISPGVYGRVDIGNAPPPLLYAQPVLIARPVRTVAPPPVYMHVPPGHAKNWSKHCARYGACGQPVYFVKSAEYEPGYRQQKEKGHGKGRGH